LGGAQPPRVRRPPLRAAAPGWLAWVQRLGVSSMRIFGLAGAISNLQAFVGSTWGNDLNNSPVINQATFNASVAALRTPAGHLSASPATPWANPPLWSAYSGMMNQTAAAPDGNSMYNIVTSLQAINVEVGPPAQARGPLLAAARPSVRRRRRLVRGVAPTAAGPGDHMSAPRLDPSLPPPAWHCRAEGLRGRRWSPPSHSRC